MGSSQTRARTRVPCTGRQILNHCVTMEALDVYVLNEWIQEVQGHPDSTHRANFAICLSKSLPFSSLTEHASQVVDRHWPKPIMRILFLLSSSPSGWEWPRDPVLAHEIERMSGWESVGRLCFPGERGLWGPWLKMARTISPAPGPTLLCNVTLLLLHQEVEFISHPCDWPCDLLCLTKM